MDWDSNPELQAMRNDFILSLGERAMELEQALTEVRNAEDAAREALGAGPDAMEQAPAGFEPSLEAIMGVAHKLAGVAKSYGFDELGLVSGALDDWLSLASDSERLEPGRAVRYGGWLLEAIHLAIEDDGESIPGWAELLEAAERARLNA